MKCPKCGFVSFNYLETCRKCGNDLSEYRQERGFMDLAPGVLDISAPIIVEEGAESQEPEGVGVEERLTGAQEDTAGGETALEADGEGEFEIRLEEPSEQTEVADLVPEVDEEEISMSALEELSEEQEESPEEIGMPTAEDSSVEGDEEPVESVEDLVLELEEVSEDQQGPKAASPEGEETSSLEMESEGGEPSEAPSPSGSDDNELILELEDEDEDEDDKNSGPGRNPAGGKSPGAELDEDEDDSSPSFEIHREKAEEIRGIIEEINQPPNENEDPGTVARLQSGTALVPSLPPFPSSPSPLGGEGKGEGGTPFRQNTWRQAGMVRRLLAYVTDHLVLGTCALVLTVGFLGGLYAAGKPLSSPEAFLQTLRFLGLGVVPWISSLLLFYTAYYLYLVGSRGQTWGQALFGIRVVSEDSSPVGFARSALRLGGAFLSWISFGLGFLWAALDRHHQGWSEKLSGTFVILS